jgi:hypothetical protein
MSHSYATGLLPPYQFRPLSVLSLNSSHGPVHEDDTMISVGVDHFAHEFFAEDNLQMPSAGHVRRRSLVSAMEASPCVRIEKRTYSAIQAAMAFKNVERHESPNKVSSKNHPSHRELRPRRV